MWAQKTKLCKKLVYVKDGVKLALGVICSQILKHESHKLFMKRISLQNHNDVSGGGENQFGLFHHEKLKMLNYLIHLFGVVEISQKINP